MLNNRYVAHDKEKLEEWGKKLTTISTMIDEWLLFQRNWMNLENIFMA